MLRSQKGGLICGFKGVNMAGKRILRSMLDVFKIFLKGEQYDMQRAVCVANMRIIAREFGKPSPEIDYLLTFPTYASEEEYNNLYNILRDYVG